MTDHPLYYWVQQAAFWAAMIYCLRRESRYAGQTGGSEEQDADSRHLIRVCLFGGMLLGWLVSLIPVTRWQHPAIFWIGIAMDCNRAMTGWTGMSTP